MSAILETVEQQSDYSLTRHAWERMHGRRLSPAAVGLVLNYGRATDTRGATIYVVGRKEVEQYRRNGIELSAVEGVQVVCTVSGTILTVYRNKDLRGLRSQSRQARRRCPR